MSDRITGSKGGQQVVQFVFDYRSIYSYLANSQVESLGAIIDYHPVDIVGVMKEVNNQPSPLCPPKLAYAHVDARRWADLYHLRLAPNEPLLNAMKQGTVKSGLLSRVAIAAQQMGIFKQVSDALFSAVWDGADDLATEQGRVQFLASHAFPEKLWQVADSSEVFAQLARNNELAIARGVFGVPTFFVNQEMFFGNDRLHFVRERLESSSMAGAAR